LNFSMKYNMNGGSCTLRFIPYQDGTAVNVRFTLAQGMGARYEAYDRALTQKAAEILGLPPLPLQLNVEAFLEERNWVTADHCPPPIPQAPPAAAPVCPPPVLQTPPMCPPVISQLPPTEIPAQPVQQEHCPGCGAEVLPGARFCFQCGVSVEIPRCKACGSTLPPQARFCPYCGEKQ
jgi:hypothetical protein